MPLRHAAIESGTGQVRVDRTSNVGLSLPSAPPVAAPSSRDLRPRPGHAIPAPGNAREHRPDEGIHGLDHAHDVPPLEIVFIRKRAVERVP